MPRVRKKTGRIPHNGALVDRTTKWGNPFVIGPAGDRDEVCDRHAEWFEQQRDLIAELPELRDLDLFCHCAPERCHAEYLLMRANPDTAITVFTGEYRFLSNFYQCPVHYLKRTWPSAEHAYQAAKSLRPEDHERIFHASTPGEAKRLGRQVALRPDWESRKLGIMAAIVERKFSENPDLRARLLETGDRELVEGNTWGDRFWGVYRGEGRNELGKILMEVRTQLRSEIDPEPVKQYESHVDNMDPPIGAFDDMPEECDHGNAAHSCSLCAAGDRPDKPEDFRERPELRCKNCKGHTIVECTKPPTGLNPDVPHYRFGCKNCGNVPDDGFDVIDPIALVLAKRPKEGRRAALELLYLRICEIENTSPSPAYPIKRALQAEKLELEKQSPVAEWFESVGQLNGLAVRFPALKGERFVTVFLDCLELMTKIAGPAAADWSSAALRKEFARRVRNAIAREPSVILDPQPPETGLEVAVRELTQIPKANIMPTVNGEPFHCPECNVRIFQRGEKPNSYVCNGCGAQFIGEPAETDPQVFGVEAAAPAEKTEKTNHKWAIPCDGTCWYECCAGKTPRRCSLLKGHEQHCMCAVDDVEMTAEISADGLYRTVLKRIWNAEAPIFVLVGLNPSTADDKVDDPTIRRGIGFARREGCGSLVMLNAYAWRATDPTELDTQRAAAVDVIGFDNDATIRAELARAFAIEGSKVVVAWGQNVEKKRAREVAALIREAGFQPLCLGLTKRGDPKHPLRLAGDTPLEVLQCA